MLSTSRALRDSLPVVFLGRGKPSSLVVCNTATGIDNAKSDAHPIHATNLLRATVDYIIEWLAMAWLPSWSPGAFHAFTTRPVETNGIIIS